MAISSTIKKLFHALSSRAIKRRQFAQLRECDPRMLKDMGLRWERGTLVAINPEREPAPQQRKAVTRDAHESCPHCGSRLT
ncbi:protein of unknown function [Franzmannia pantelleriensis]|uniref:YjiS-like domain-containing protein n=1 Tax=Franzmannia pantelleriensis TaxID=48727 RepID=A0A1G9R003_9GAMM|nr:DUF1127 domain-containing protein [Halomonas pantelleriensis]SDM16564.1 protein of unknown function [Halomonas pantelleriensis]